MNYEKVLGEHKFPTYEELKSGLIRLIDEGKISREDAARLLPELRESEDERIRKWLLDYAIEMIAGLESDISLSTYNGIKGYDPDAEAELTQWQKARAYLEKQKEQKPAGWSDEDEKKIGRLRSVVNQLASYTDSLDVNGDYCEGDYAELDTWLKSLRPQPQGTYKLIVHNIYEMLKDKDFFDITPSHRVSLLNDIRVRCKNADEQAEILDVPSWKPSEEQMEALERASTNKYLSAKQFDILVSLYEQLKKL